MSLHRKKWSKKDKEEVLLYNDQHGVSQTSREFNISSATIYNWKKKYDELGTSSSVQVDSFVLRNPPERKSRKR
jgi:transposase-like protein